MTNILISYYSDYGEAMYDALTNILLDNGNSVFRLNINNPSVSITSWGGNSNINNEELLNQIKDFNPSVILNFNNCLPQNCYDIIDLNCKICAIDADAPEVAFWNKNALLENTSRIFFLGLQSYSKIMYERYLSIKLTNQNYLYFPPATVVKNEKLTQDKNISFIGSNFYPQEIPQYNDFYSVKGLKLYDALKDNYFFTLDEARELCHEIDNIEGVHEYIRGFYVGQERLKYMQQLVDLGFTFYGIRGWDKIAYYDFELAKCYDPTPKITIEENQWVYNTSKLSINISHPLAKSSFSWRVMDIMASNSCLLTEDKPDWRELFGQYLNQETLDSIIYTDRFDMRDKAKRLLADEQLRQRCVNDLNQAIEKNGRWIIRLKSLEKFLNIQLINCNSKSQYIEIKRKENEISQIVKNDNYQKQNIKKRHKLFFYLIQSIIAQIPLINLLYNKKYRKKIKKGIDKYWI